MLTTSNSGVFRTTPSSASIYYQSSTERIACVQDTGCTPHQYDSVTISASPTGEILFQKELVSRLSNEIRTVTTTGDIQALRQQVSSGTYQVDPSCIAARMLYLGEA